MSVLIGKNSVVEALRAGRPINKILVAKGNTGSTKEIRDLAREHGAIVQEAETSILDKHSENQRHQGVVALVAPYEYADSDAVLAACASKAQPLIVVLNEIQDPHNFGAIIRSCEAAGVDAIVISQRRCCPLNETVARASAGAIEHMRIVKVGNLTQYIAKLKDSGFWIAGADMDGESLWSESVKVDMPLALIIGGENKGLGTLLKSECDFVYSIPMIGHINSLNASVAAAILVFDVLRRRNAQNKM